MAEQQDIGRLMEYSLSRVAVGQASRLSPTSKHFSSSHTVFVIQKIFRKMKAVKLETGATPFLRGELRARIRFGLHRSGLAGVNSKELSGEKIRVYLRVWRRDRHGAIRRLHSAIAEAMADRPWLPTLDPPPSHKGAR